MGRASKIHTYIFTLLNQVEYDTEKGGGMKNDNFLQTATDRETAYTHDNKQWKHAKDNTTSNESSTTKKIRTFQLDLMHNNGYEQDNKKCGEDRIEASGMISRWHRR